MGVKLLIAALLMCSMTLCWSQSNSPSSTNSGELLKTWDLLSSQFEKTLDSLEGTLVKLSQKQATLEANGELLSYLCNELSRQNNGLKSYNAQISQRMQERDEDLALAYEEMEKFKRVIEGLSAWAVIATCIGILLVFIRLL